MPAQGKRVRLVCWSKHRPEGFQTFGMFCTEKLSGCDLIKQLTILKTKKQLTVLTTIPYCIRRIICVRNKKYLAAQ